MRKIGIGNFQLPAGKGNAANWHRLLPQHELDELKTVTSASVLQMVLRALERAGRYDCRHPFWNSLANCYLKIGQRLGAMNENFPGIQRVIHNNEVKKGDLLVSDFDIGLYYGYMNGGTQPVGIRALEVDGDLLKGMVIREGMESGEIGYFKNELWWFISHRFTVLSSKKSRI